MKKYLDIDTGLTPLQLLILLTSLARLRFALKTLKMVQEFYHWAVGDRQKEKIEAAPFPFFRWSRDRLRHLPTTITNNQNLRLPSRFPTEPAIAKPASLRFRKSCKPASMIVEIRPRNFTENFLLTLLHFYELACSEPIYTVTSPLSEMQSQNEKTQEIEEEPP